MLNILLWNKLLLLYLTVYYSTYTELMNYIYFSGIFRIWLKQLLENYLYELKLRKNTAGCLEIITNY